MNLIPLRKEKKEHRCLIWHFIMVTIRTRVVTAKAKTKTIRMCSFQWGARKKRMVSEWRRGPLVGRFNKISLVLERALSKMGSRKKARRKQLLSLRLSRRLKRLFRDLLKHQWRRRLKHQSKRSPKMSRPESSQKKAVVKKQMKKKKLKSKKKTR